MSWIIEVFYFIVTFAGIFLAVILNDFIPLTVSVLGLLALVVNSIIIYYKELQELFDLMKDVVKENRRILEKYGKNL